MDTPARGLRSQPSRGSCENWRSVRPPRSFISTSVKSQRDQGGRQWSLPTAPEARSQSSACADAGSAATTCATTCGSRAHPHRGGAARRCAGSQWGDLHRLDGGRRDRLDAHRAAPAWGTPDTTEPHQADVPAALDLSTGECPRDPPDSVIEQVEHNDVPSGDGALRRAATTVRRRAGVGGYTAGCRVCQSVSCSYAWATRHSSASLRCRPTNWTP